MKKKPDAPLRRRRRPVAAIAAAACGTALSALSLPSRADVPAMLDPNLQVTTVLNSGITQPIGIVFLGSVNDYLVLEKASGQIKRVIGGVLQPTPVLDLAVNSNSERGLLSMVLHPNFPGTPFVYVRWTESTTGADSTAVAQVPLLGNRVDRFIWNGVYVHPGHQPHQPARAPDRQRPRARATPARTTPTRTATTTAASCASGPTASCMCSWATWAGAAGCRTCANGPFLTAPLRRRHVRRPGTRQRPPHRRDPAPQRGRHDAGRQPVLRGRRGDGRRGWRQHPEGLFVRAPQRLRHGVRPAFRARCGKPRTPTTPTAS